MQHIGNILQNIETFVSRDEVLKSRLIDICQSFLNINLQSKNIKVSDRIIVVSGVVYVEKILLNREKQTLLAYVHSNSHGFCVDDLVIK